MQPTGRTGASLRPGGTLRWRDKEALVCAGAARSPAADAHIVRLLPQTSGSDLALSAEERWRLDSFRRAAAQVREASIIAEGRRIQLHAVPGDPGYVDILVELLGNEPFRSLALAIRLAYQQTEPAYYYSVCNLLYREGSGEIRQRVADLRAEYRSALSATENQVTADEEGEVVVFGAQEAFDHWL
jgi:hypothetical protein